MCFLLISTKRNVELQIKHPNWVWCINSNYRITMDSSTNKNQSALKVALISTGIECSVVSTAQSGWSISVHGDKLNIQPSTRDSVGRGTDLALCLMQESPNAQLVGIDIFNGQGKTTSTLLLKALEKALDLQCDVIVVCVHSFNESKGFRFSKICAYAERNGIPIVASAVFESPSYPSNIDTVFGCLSNADCRERMYVYESNFFDESHPHNGLFVLNGWWQGRFWGSEIATVRLAGEVTRLLEMGTPYSLLSVRLSLQAFVPFSEFGFV